MKQPWKQWSYRQRHWFSAFVFVQSAFLFVVFVAVDGLESWAVVGLVFVVLIVPTLYVQLSSSKAAEKRYEDGDESGFSPAVIRARKAHQAKRRDSS